VPEKNNIQKLSHKKDISPTWPEAEHVSGAENGAERAENRMSGAVSRHSRKRFSGSGACSQRPLSGSGAQSGQHRPLKVRSHLLTFR